ncbi:MAG: type II secretion system protein N [Gammaproteobacteria bacterium]|nr:type II secretion system protein N [Gammaproteobacteria bacterium]MBT4607544.1 type II secretion system protein N [Thiotrichales bacterium]MBT3967177.1 type II secretion system protein N [Gammaproteobacteria bacterium]MBT4080773.1 type II secretion system protein N [Gammaproteobacteria bacterium]MBT4330822.1 type II secretion system protein N [Gammaproteobacteria bacterium]
MNHWKSFRRYSLFFLLAISITLPVMLPTKLLVGWVQPNTGKVELYDYYGTLWNGGARLVAYENRVIGGVEWNFDFFSLFSGAAIWKLEMRGDKEITALARGGVSFLGTAQIESLYLDLPVYKVTTFLNREIASLGGRATVDLTELNLDRDHPRFSMMGSVKLSDLQIGREKATPIGSFVATLNREGEGSKIVFKHSGKSAIELNVITHIEPTGEYKTGGTAELNGDMGASVKTLLAWVGKRKGSNKFEMKKRGNLWMLMEN